MGASNLPSPRSIWCLPAGALVAALALALSCRAAPAPVPPLGTITIATSIPQTRASSDGIPALINALILEAPILIGWDGRPVKRAIDSWSWSVDGLALRLHVTAGIHFHDGTLLTNVLAADILRDALKPVNGALSTTVESVTASGEDGILIRTGQPEGFLLSDISLADFALPGKPNVGTGPFVLKSRVDPISLTAFAGYRMGRPEINEVRIKQYATQRQAYAAMMRGEADVLYEVSGDALGFVQAETSIRTYPFMRAYYQALVFNLKLAPFTRPGVRKALSKAIDRQAVIDGALRKRGLPADGPVWPYHFGHTTGNPASTYDPANARILLDAEGLTAGRENRPGRVPSRFHFTCITAREDQELERVARLVQKQLLDSGVDMDVELVASKDLARRVSTGDFQGALLQLGSARSLSFTYAFWHSPIPELPGFLNLPYSSADAALDRLRGAFREEDVASAVRDFQTNLLEDPPAVFLAWLQTARAVRSDITIPTDGTHDIIGSIQQWGRARKPGSVP